MTDKTEEKKGLSAKSIVFGLLAVVTVGGSLAGLFADSIGIYQSMNDEPELSPKVEAMRKDLNGLFTSFQAPAAPGGCLPKEEAQLTELMGHGKLLRGGKAKGKRPQDAAAVKALARFTEKHADAATAYALLAQANLYNGEAPRTVKTAAKVAAKLCPEWAFPANLVGTAYFIEKDWDEAEVSYREALGKSVNYAGPRFNLAMISLQRKEPAKAIEELDKLIEAHPFHKNAHLLRANANMQAGNSDKALQDARQAVANDENNAPAHFILGNLMKASGDDKAAQQHHCKAKALDQRFAQLAADCGEKGE